MTKSNFCVIGPARSRTTLIADALHQAYPQYQYIHEPGLLNSQNEKHLDYSKARVDSKEEIASAIRAVKGNNVIVKMVAGATFFDLSDQDLQDFADNCQIILTTRIFVDAAVSYLAAMKTRRFFDKGQNVALDVLTYRPETDYPRLFWYANFYLQVEKWKAFLQQVGIRFTEVNYSQVSSYSDVGRVLNLPSVSYSEQVKAPYTKSYSDLFSNYYHLVHDCTNLEKAMDLL